MQDKPDVEMGKVLPFEKPKKRDKPAFNTISLEELKERMKKQGFQPFDKNKWKNNVSKQQSQGSQDVDLIQNIRELQEVCRILSQNLQMVHKEVEQRLTDQEGHITWMENQLLDLSKVVQQITMYLQKPPTS
jgi:hypothetical protein